jgi:hypothetical protein
MCVWTSSKAAGHIQVGLRKFTVYSVGNLSPAMGARNQVGIGLSYRPASLCSLATQFQTRFLELIPCPIAGLKFSALYTGESTEVGDLVRKLSQLIRLS